MATSKKEVNQNPLNSKLNSTLGLANGIFLFLPDLADMSEMIAIQRMEDFDKHVVSNDCL